MHSTWIEPLEPGIWTVVGAFTICACFISLRKPIVGLLFLGILCGLFTYKEFPSGAGTISFIRILTPFAVIGTLMDPRRLEPFRRDRLIMICIIALGLSFIPPIMHPLSRSSYLLPRAIKVLGYVSIVWMAIILLDSEKRIVQAVSAIVATGVVISLITLALRPTFTSATYHFYGAEKLEVGRFIGTSRAPNTFGGHLALLLPFVLGLALLTRKLRWRLALLATIPVVGMALALTFSRSAIGGAALGMALMVVGLRKQMSREVVITLVLCVVGMLFIALTRSEEMFAYLERRMGTIGLETYSRMGVAGRRVSLLWHDPFVFFFGWGQPVHKLSQQWRALRLSAHNIFLDTALMQGMAGLIPLVVFLTLHMVSALKGRIRRESSRVTSIICWSSFASMTAYMVHCFFHSSLYGTAFWFLFGVGRASVLLAQRQYDKHHAKRASKKSKVPRETSPPTYRGALPYPFYGAGRSPASGKL